MKEQYRCPQGEDGRKVIEGMNEHHRPLTEWALSKAEGNPETILDIGCGGGMLLGLLHEKFPEAHLSGIDISEESVAATVGRNSALVREGILNVEQGSVSDLPYGGNIFDMVTAVETYFFWPDLENDMKEAARVLRKGGLMLVASEVYALHDGTERGKKMADEYGAKIVSNDTMIKILGKAGIKASATVSEKDGWVVFIGRKS